MKKYIQLVALFVATTSIFAQSQDFQTNYTFSECEGAFPTILNYNITDLVVNSANNDSYSGDMKNGFYYKNSFDLINMMPFSKSRVNDIFEATGFKNVLFFGVNTSDDKAYKFMRVTDNNGYNDMYKFTNGTRKGNPTKDNKFITKTFSQID